MNADVERHKAACLSRFMKAVSMGRRQDYAGCQTIVERIRVERGESAAKTARQELFNFIKSGKEI